MFFPEGGVPTPTGSFRTRPGRSTFGARASAFANLGSSCATDLLANFGPVPGVPPSADLPQLQPYRSLDVSRLRLHGSGAWQIAPFLEGSLWLPFLEPGILRHGLPLGAEDLPDFEKEDADEHLKLALLWDAKGLLQLVPPTGPSEARALHEAATRAYESQQVAGSPAKDVLGSTLFQAIGAEVDSRGPQVSRACVPVAAPLARRVALATLSLRAARLRLPSCFRV